MLKTTIMTKTINHGLFLGIGTLNGDDYGFHKFRYQPQQDQCAMVYPGQQRTNFYYNNADVLISKKTLLGSRRC